MSETLDPGTLLVRRTAYGRPVEEREQRLPVPEFETPHIARLAMGVTSTRRVSEDMEFMKIEVRVELPCLPNDEDIRQTKDYALNLIQDILSNEQPKPVATVQSVISHQTGTPIA